MAALAAGAASAQPAASPVPFQLPPVADTAAWQPEIPLTGCGVRPLPRTARPLADTGPVLAIHRQHRGLGLMVVHRGEVLLEAHDAPGGADARLQGFSMTKTALAVLVGQAIVDGLIPPEDRPLALLEGDATKSAVPLRSLLTMSAGLAPLDEAGRQRLNLGPGIGEAALAAVATHPPDTVFDYSNASSQIAGEALRAALAAAGSDWQAYVSARLWCPLGNADAGWWAEDAQRPRTYAGITATTEDWARFGQLLLDRGAAGGQQLVPAAWIDRMTRPSAANPNYGYQVWLGDPPGDRRSYGPSLPITVPHAERFRAPDVVFLDGFGGQRVYVVPSHGLVVARLGEVDLGWDDSALLNAVLDRLPQ